MAPRRAPEQIDAGSQPFFGVRRLVSRRSFETVLLCAHRFSVDSVQFDRPTLSRPRPRVRPVVRLSRVPSSELRSIMYGDR